MQLNRKNRKPTLVFGPETELVEDFVKTVPDFLLRDRKIRLMDDTLGSMSNPITYTNVTAQNEQDFEAHLLLDLVRRVSKNSETPPPSARNTEAGFDFVSRAIREYPAQEPILCICQVLKLSDLADDRHNELQTAHAWRNTWEKIFQLVPNHILVPVLPVRLVGAPPGWQHRSKPYPPVPRTWETYLRGIFAGGPCINTHCFERFFESHEAADIATLRVGVIEPILEKYTMDWLDLEGYPAQFPQVRPLVAKNFQGKRPKRDGINMRTFIETLKKSINETQGPEAA